MFSSQHIILTGTSGYLGRLIAARLLTHRPDITIIAPVRPKHQPETVATQIFTEAARMAGGTPLGNLGRLTVIHAPPIEETAKLDTTLRHFRPDEVIHCAACLDYFDKSALDAVNVGYTHALLSQAQRLGIKRFVYVSTAFSGGLIEGTIKEEPLDEPPADPTYYTLTKRRAEHLVVESGLPYLVLRPSIIVGDSTNGRYGGKPFGLYQFWFAMERLMCRRWQSVIHTYAPNQPINLMHEDAFVESFLAAWSRTGEGFVNIVSDDAVAPTVRQLWDIWLSDCNRPTETIYYDRLEDIPINRLPPSQRAFFEYGWTNLQIIGHPWQFENTQLKRLRESGLKFTDATLETVKICQRRMMDVSPIITRFRQEVLARRSIDAPKPI